MSGELDELARVAADALVSALVTDSWEAVKRRFAAAVGQERRMDATRAELAAANGRDRDAVRQAQVRTWTIRLRDVLEDDPATAEALRRLVTEQGGQRPTVTPISQHTQADHGSQAVTVGGNISGNTGEVYVGVGKVVKRKTNIALAPFMFLVNVTKKLIAAHGAGSAVAIAVVVLGGGAVTGWRTHWPPAVFGSANTQPMRWTAVAAPLPADAAPSSASQFIAELIGVSCAADGTCMATGDYSKRGSDFGGALIETISQGIWMPTQPGPPLPHDAALSAYSRLTGVMCSSPAVCTAYGSYTTNEPESSTNGTSTSVTAGVVETLSRGTWAPYRLSLPPTAGRDQQTAVWGMACPVPANCVAVGSNSYYGTSTASGTTVESRAMIQTLANETWTPTEAALPADAAKTGEHAEFDFVACTAVDACTAVGSYTDTNGSTQALIATLANGTWTPFKAPLPGGATAHQDAALYGITCTASGSCIAVGRYTGPGGTHQGLIETMTNGTVVPARAPNPPRQKDAELGSIACAATDSCIAVGDYTTAKGRTGLIETLSNGTWIAAAAPLPANAAMTGESAYLSAVACATTSSCVAVGSYTNSRKSTEGLIETTSAGDTKTATPSPLPSSASSASPVTAPSTSSAPSPADSNPAATFGDGSRAEITVRQGDNGSVQVTLEITAGRSGLALGHPGTLQILPVDDNGKDPWSSPGTQEFYNPANITPGASPESPTDLQPGQSVCVLQSFNDPTNPQESATNVSGWTIILTLGNGTTENVTMPDGGGSGPSCDIA
ncbi:MAG TPA: hypothetical protein VF070_47705 [Streptosporangiaceae bacterium]